MNANIVAEYDNAANATLTVSVDDENLGMTLFPQAATMWERIAYTVALCTPSGAGARAVEIVMDGTLQTRALTDTATSWNTARAVPTTDDAYGADASVTLTHVAAAGSQNPV